MKAVTIFWPSHTTREEVVKIRKYFGINGKTTVNGETPAYISDNKMQMLLETEARGYIQIRRFKEALIPLLRNK